MTIRSQRDSAQLILSKEVGYIRKPHANRLRVALAFPNTYFVGMSNLGFQTVWVVEHHFREGRSAVPCNETILGALSQVTENIPRLI